MLVRGCCWLRLTRYRVCAPHGRCNNGAAVQNLRGNVFWRPVLGNKTGREALDWLEWGQSHDAT